MLTEGEYLIITSGFISDAQYELPGYNVSRELQVNQS